MKKGIKRNIYKKEEFPYDMKAMHDYARQKGVPVHTLTEKEVKQFLLTKSAK